MSAHKPGGTSPVPTRTTRRGPRRPTVLALAIAGLLGVAFAPLAVRAQAPGHVAAPTGQVPPLPPGDATLRGRVVHPDDPKAGADLAIALYALRPDGRPGLGSTRSDADGRFVFENISNDPGTVYLIGTQYRDVPFGQRVAFEAGQQAIDVEVTLRPISDDATALLTVGTTYKIDWVGAQLFVQVSHQLQNPGSSVILVPQSERPGHPPVFTTRLPDGVLEFIDGQSGFGEGLVRDGEVLSFWGPVYPGGQELRYGFLIDGPVPPATATPEQEATKLDLALPLPGGSGEVQILTPETDPRPTAPGLRVLDERTEIDDVTYVRSSLGGRSPGDVVHVTLTAPPATADTHGLRLARADYWIDHDDTSMRVTADVQVEVGAPVRVLAPPGGSLLHFDLPEGAEFLGVSSAAQAIGVVPDESGGLDVRGPLPPGRSELGFRYRVPVRDGTARLDLHFTRPVDLLNVLVADTGIVVDSPRLHKRRPFRQGTRIYLHREAFQIDPDETVSIDLTPFERTEMPRAVAGMAGIALAVGVAAFLVVPLRRTRRAVPEIEPARSELATERENVYEALRDLDHDHETGKVDDEDYERMRRELRANAVELMRRERTSATGPAVDAPAPSCPACRGTIEADWRFCSHCGARLEPGAPA